MTAMLAHTFGRTIMGSTLTNMATTKRNLSVLRRVRDGTLTYSVIMQARVAKKARTVCQNDQAVSANIVGYRTY